MKKIFYVFRTPRKKMLKNYLNGKEPDNGLYGFNHLKKMGYQVDFSDVAYHSFNLLIWFFYPLQKIFINNFSTGFKIDQALLLIPKLLQNDVIITTTDSAGLPILLLKKIGLLKKKIIYISIGLVNEFSQDDNSKIQKFVINLLKIADKIVCYSPSEQKALSRLIPQMKSNIFYIPFGIDNNYFKCSKKSHEIILSVGRDKSRDYQLIAKIAKQLPDEKFVIVASRPNVINVNFPKNVQVNLDLPYLSVKKLLCKSKLVILPLKEINRASGQIAFLEALSMGNKMVISKVKGISESYPDLIDQKSVFLYQEGSFEDALNVIKKALKNKYSKSSIKSYNSLNSTKKLDYLIKTL